VALAAEGYAATDHSSSTVPLGESLCVQITNEAYCVVRELVGDEDLQAKFIKTLKDQLAPRKRLKHITACLAVRGRPGFKDM
jgi:hypothetical protein